MACAGMYQWSKALDLVAISRLGPLSPNPEALIGTSSAGCIDICKLHHFQGGTFGISLIFETHIHIAHYFKQFLKVFIMSVPI